MITPAKATSSLLALLLISGCHGQNPKVATYSCADLQQAAGELLPTEWELKGTQSKGEVELTCDANFVVDPLAPPLLTIKCSPMVTGVEFVGSLRLPSGIELTVDASCPEFRFAKNASISIGDDYTVSDSQCSPGEMANTIEISGPSIYCNKCKMVFESNVTRAPQDITTNVHPAKVGVAGGALAIHLYNGGELHLRGNKNSFGGDRIALGPGGDDTLVNIVSIKVEERSILVCDHNLSVQGIEGCTTAPACPCLLLLPSLRADYSIATDVIINGCPGNNCGDDVGIIIVREKSKIDVKNELDLSDNAVEVDGAGEVEVYILDTSTLNYRRLKGEPLLEESNQSGNKNKCNADAEHELRVAHVHIIILVVQWWWQFWVLVSLAVEDAGIANLRRWCCWALRCYSWRHCVAGWMLVFYLVWMVVLWIVDFKHIVTQPVRGAAQEIEVGVIMNTNIVVLFVGVILWNTMTEIDSEFEAWLTRHPEAERVVAGHEMLVTGGKWPFEGHFTISEKCFRQPVHRNETCGFASKHFRRYIKDAAKSICARGPCRHLCGTQFVFFYAIPAAGGILWLFTVVGSLLVTALNPSAGTRYYSRFADVLSTLFGLVNRTVVSVLVLYCYWCGNQAMKIAKGCYCSETPPPWNRWSLENDNRTHEHRQDLLNIVSLKLTRLMLHTGNLIMPLTNGTALWVAFGCDDKELLSEGLTILVILGLLIGLRLWVNLTVYFFLQDCQKSIWSSEGSRYLPEGDGYGGKRDAHSFTLEYGGKASSFQLQLLVTLFFGWVLPLLQGRSASISL
ncbi:unnamed protein product [Chrysoparadoxa australica]